MTERPVSIAVEIDRTSGAGEPAAAGLVKPLAVAIVNGPERLFGPRPEVGDELLVRAEPQQRDGPVEPA